MRHAAFSPDGNWLATCGCDAQVRSTVNFPGEDNFSAKFELKVFVYGVHEHPARQVFSADLSAYSSSFGWSSCERCEFSKNSRFGTQK